MSNKSVILAKKIKNDEFYTIYEQFEAVVNKWLIDKLEDKVIYCPCDAEWSNIVKVLQDYKDALKYKELIYTSDDFRTHDDLFEYCDIVITNPPFSLAREFYQMLKKHKCMFMFYGDIKFVYKNIIVEDIIKNDVIYLDCRELKVYNDKFLTPDGSIKLVHTYLYTNIKGLWFNKDFQFKYKYNDVQDKVYYSDYGILCIKNFRYVPKDYKGLIALSPLSYHKWQDQFEVVCYGRITDKLCRVNGKIQFIRWIVKLKDSDARLEDYIKNAKINRLF